MDRRFSLWSIDLSLAEKIGFEAFEALFVGAHFMDKHFRTAPLAESMLVLNALVGMWNPNFLGHQISRRSALRWALEAFACLPSATGVAGNGREDTAKRR